MRTVFGWRQFCRRVPGCLVMLLVSVVISVLLCTLHGSQLQIDEELETIVDKIKVTCSVTDLTGTQSDQLGLPEWTVNLFFADTTTVGGEALERSFASYIGDVRAKATLSAQYVGEKISLVGLTFLDADQTTWQESGFAATWLEGRSEELFLGGDDLCLLPQALYDTLEEDESGVRRILLSFSGSEGDTEREFTVAGFYTGGSGAIYCPWSVIVELSQEIQGYYFADGLSATFRDNREIEDFWQDCAGLFFVPPDASGTQVEWEASTLYRYYPYALFINDNALQQTQTALERNQTVLMVISGVILVLSLAVVFCVGFLVTRKRERDLALQCVLGVSRQAMFIHAFGEQLLLALAGMLLGTMGYFVVTGSAPAWAHMGIYLAVCALGVAGAILFVLKNDFTAILKGE